MTAHKQQQQKQQQEDDTPTKHVQFSQPLEQVRLIQDDTIITWSIVVKPHEPFSFESIIPEGSQLHVTSAVLEVELNKHLGTSHDQMMNNEKELEQILEENEAHLKKLKEKNQVGENPDDDNDDLTTTLEHNVPMPKHIEEFLKAKQSMELKYNSKLADVKPYGCALQVCLFEPTEKKRRKFMIGTLSTKADTELVLNQRFDWEQVNNLTFEIQGRPELDLTRCKVHLLGNFLIPSNVSDVKRVKRASMNNFHEEKVKQLLREKDPESAPWKIQLMERNKKLREKEIEDEDKVKEDHTDPKQFVRKGVEIFNVLVGHGRRAQIGDKVKIAYKGRLNPDANKCFDKTTLKHPFSFRLGSKKVIKGINIGVEGMTLNAKRELVIPPNRAFGVQGIPEKVPPNATVYYDIELVDLIPKKKAEQMRVKEQQEKQREENAKKRKTYAGINKLTKELVTLDDGKKSKNKKRKTN